MPTCECLRCRYDLSKTPESAEGDVWKCPECGRVNTRAEMAGDTGWSPQLVRGIVLGVLTGVNLLAGFTMGCFAGDRSLAEAIVLALCAVEVGVLLLLARLGRRTLSWLTVLVFVLMLFVGGRLGVTVGIRVARWMAGNGALVVPPAPGIRRIKAGI